MPLPKKAEAKAEALNTKVELANSVRQTGEITNSLKSLEVQLFGFEGSYLEETQDIGNIIQGWNRSGFTSTNITRKRRMHFEEEHRLFSNSSTTSASYLNTPENDNSVVVINKNDDKSNKENEASKDNIDKVKTPSTPANKRNKPELTIAIDNSNQTPPKTQAAGSVKTKRTVKKFRQTTLNLKRDK